MTLTPKQRALLRSECNTLRALVHLGGEGLSQPFLSALDDALRTHVLVKVQLPKQGDAKPRAIAADLAEALGAEVVQVIGKTTTLYRDNPELKPRKDGRPPWR